MPNFSRRIYFYAKHRNHKPRTASRHGLQSSFISGAKLRSAQGNLPELSAAHSRLLMDIRHHRLKLGHTSAHLPSTVAWSNSISRTLPTQNGVR